MKKRLKITIGIVLAAILCLCIVWFSPISEALIDMAMFGVFADEETILSDDGTHELVIAYQRRRSPIKSAYVTLRKAGKAEQVYACESAWRLIDFRGVYWAKDSLDFYVSSGDVGISCFVYGQGTWWAGALQQTTPGVWLATEDDDGSQKALRSKEINPAQIPQEVLAELTALPALISANSQ